MKALQTVTSSARQAANKAGQLFNAWGGEYMTQKTLAHVDFMSQPETLPCYMSAEATALSSLFALLGFYRGDWLLGSLALITAAYQGTVTAKQLGGVNKAINFFKPATAAVAPAPAPEETNAKKAN